MKMQNVTATEHKVMYVSVRMQRSKCWWDLESDAEVGQGVHPTIGCTSDWLKEN